MSSVAGDEPKADWRACPSCREAYDITKQVLGSTDGPPVSISCKVHGWVDVSASPVSSPEVVFVDGPPRGAAMATTEAHDLWTSDLGEYARLLGRKWADDQAAAGHLMFHPTAVQAHARLEEFVTTLHRSMSDAMTAAAMERRNELAQHPSQVLRRLQPTNTEET